METRAKLMDEQGLTWDGMPKSINNIAEYEEKIKRDEEARVERRQLELRRIRVPILAREAF